MPTAEKELFLSSTHIDINPKQTHLIKKRLGTSLVFALALGAAIAWTQPSFGSFFGKGGPWRALANVPECSSLGRVCAEWPFQSSGQQYLAVCCISQSDLGSTAPPNETCAPGGMLMIRRGASTAVTW